METDTLQQTIAIFIAAAPFFLAPMLFKFAFTVLNKIKGGGIGKGLGRLQQAGNSAIFDRMNRGRNKVAENYDPLLEKGDKPGKDDKAGRKAYRKQRRRNFAARVATGNVLPGTRSRAMTKQSGEEHLGKELGIAANSIEDIKFSKDSLKDRYERENAKKGGGDFYTKYAIAKQLANLGAGEKLGDLLNSEEKSIKDSGGIASGQNMTNLKILSRAINDKHELKGSHHQVFYKAAGMQSAFADGLSDSAQVLAKGRAVAAKKAVDDMGADTVLAQSPDGIEEFSNTFNDLMKEPGKMSMATEIDATTGKEVKVTNKRAAELLKKRMGDAMHTVASQERLLPRLSGARNVKMEMAEVILNAEKDIGTPVAYRDTLSNTKKASDARAARNAEAPTPPPPAANTEWPPDDRGYL